MSVDEAGGMEWEEEEHVPGADCAICTFCK